MELKIGYVLKRAILTLGKVNDQVIDKNVETGIGNFIKLRMKFTMVFKVTGSNKRWWLWKIQRNQLWTNVLKLGLEILWNLGMTFSMVFKGTGIGCFVVYFRKWDGHKFWN